MLKKILLRQKPLAIFRHKKGIFGISLEEFIKIVIVAMLILVFIPVIFNFQSTLFAGETSQQENSFMMLDMAMSGLISRRDELVVDDMVVYEYDKNFKIQEFDKKEDYILGENIYKPSQCKYSCICLYKDKIETGIPNRDKNVVFCLDYDIERIDYQSSQITSGRSNGDQVNLLVILSADFAQTNKYIFYIGDADNPDAQAKLAALQKQRDTFAARFKADELKKFEEAFTMAYKNKGTEFRTREVNYALLSVNDISGIGGGDQTDNDVEFDSKKYHFTIANDAFNKDRRINTGFYGVVFDGSSFSVSTKYI